MTNQEMQEMIDALRLIESKMSKRREYILVASEFLVNLIDSTKDKNLITDFEENYRIYSTLHYDIKIYVEHMFKGYRAILYKDGDVMITIDEQGNGKIFKRKNENC